MSPQLQHVECVQAGFELVESAVWCVGPAGAAPDRRPPPGATLALPLQKYAAEFGYSYISAYDDCYTIAGTFL